MKRRFLLLFLFLLVPAYSLHAQKRAFTIEDLYRVKGVSDAHISPDGKSVVYTLTSSDLPRARRVTHIWMMDINGRNARQLTEHEKGANSPRFSPDGRSIAFISTMDSTSNLYLMTASGGKARKLTNISTGVADPLWSPDGRSIAFTTEVYPECSSNDDCNKKIADRWAKGALKAHMADDLLYRHWTAWKDGTRTHIFLASATTGEVRDLTPGQFDAPPFSLGGPLAYDFSPDGKEFVYSSNHDKAQASSTNSDLWLLSLTDRQAAARNITQSNAAYDGSPKYSPDGKYIAYRLQKQPGYESDLFRLAIYDRATGKTSVLTEAHRNWVDEFEWAEDSKAIYFSGPFEGQTPIYRVELEPLSISRVLADATILGFDFGPGASRAVYIKSSVGEPAEIYRVDLASGKVSGDATRLTSINQQLAQEVDIRPAESIWVEGAGGARVQVFIVKPHDFDTNKKYPLILNVHGGPQSMWSDAFRGDWQVYPGAGYVVAFPNPHGSTGYGQEFTAQISGDWAGRIYDDLMKVTDSLEKLPYIDRSRMGAMGWSYGGYMMMWFEGHTERFKALAAMMGLYDLRSFYGATEELWFPEWDLKGQPWNSDVYEKWSPSRHVKNFKTPCLVITGERDYRVPYTQSLQFFTALQKMSVPSRLIVYSNAGHWPSWYEMALYYTAHLEWFNKYLGGGPPPWSTEAFLRNAVFDKETGKRLPEESPEDGNGPASLKRIDQQKRPDQIAPTKNRQGKPDVKPRT
jgi:dipeptidyl aminopeptidase/acylaminoacyl peptidase